MEQCRTREPDPHAGSRFEQEAQQDDADVGCVYCDHELEESDVHLVRGEAFCAECALDEASRLRMDPHWKTLTPAVQIEVLEAFQSAAAEVESGIRAELRRKEGK